MHSGCNIVEQSKALEALAEVCDGFFDGRRVGAGAAPLPPDRVPSPYRELLVHQDHMTTVLETHCGEPVRLEVLRTRHEPHEYARKIALHPATRSHILEIGIARINLDAVGEPVRTGILEARRPLGEILIAHDVLRRVDPGYFYQFTSGSPILEDFGTPAVQEAYGRVGVIHCNGREGVRLLEVVRAEGLRRP